MSNLKLREVIKQIRSCKTAAEERAVISKESALIRNAFKEKDCDHRNRNIAKLLFFNLLGYPTHFGQIECIKLVAQSSYTEKRIGYLGLSQLLDESSEILMMVTNQIKKDLNEKGNNALVSLGLTAIAEISTEHMCRELYPEVKRLMKSSSPYIKQKAVLAAIRTIKNIPDTIEDFLEIIDQLIYDKSQSVLLATTTLMTEILRVDDSYIKPFRKYITALVRILKNLLMSGYNPEYEISGVKDPFLQVRILQLLKRLGEKDSAGSDEMSDILAQIATNTEQTKNPGNSVLSECVRTIMGIEASQGLRVLGINILGRFLMNRENNVRFVALQALQQVVDIDYNAVKRHQATITDCLKDHDLVIKKKALDLLYKITNQSNVKSIVKELVNYLLIADSEFKKELSNKICMACEKYAPNKKWHIDTVIKVLTLSEGHVREEFISQLITVIATTPDLHQYSVVKAYYAMKENLNQIGMVQLGIWLVGEFGEMLVNGTAKDPDGNQIVVDEDEIIDVYERILNDHNKKGERSDTIICWILTALSKLTIRMRGIQDKVKDLIKFYTTHMNVEIQQRACEFLQLFDSKWDTERVGIFEPIPFKGDENMTVDATNRPIFDDDDQENSNNNGSSNFNNGSDNFGSGQPKQKKAVETSNAAPTDNMIDLDIILSGGYSQPQNQAPQQNQSSGGVNLIDDLMDVFGGNKPQQQQQQQSYQQNNLLGGIDDLIGMSSTAPSNNYGYQQQQPQQQQQQQQKPGTSFLAYQDPNLTINFQILREDPQTLAVKAYFSNTSQQQVTGVNLQVAVQKYMKLNIMQATGQDLRPLQQDGLTQDMKLNNSLDGQKPYALKIRVLYTLTQTGQQVNETKVINGLPQV
eukprot:403348089